MRRDRGRGRQRLVDRRCAPRQHIRGDITVASRDRRAGPRNGPNTDHVAPFKLDAIWPHRPIGVVRLPPSSEHPHRGAVVDPLDYSRSSLPGFCRQGPAPTSRLPGERCWGDDRPGLLIRQHCPSPRSCLPQWRRSDSNANGRHRPRWASSSPTFATTSVVGHPEEPRRPTAGSWATRRRQKTPASAGVFIVGATGLEPVTPSLSS